MSTLVTGHWHTTLLTSEPTKINEVGSGQKSIVHDALIDKQPDTHTKTHTHKSIAS